VQADDSPSLAILRPLGAQAAQPPRGTVGQQVTRSPTASPVTPSPTARTVPANSWPRVTGMKGIMNP